MGIDLQNPAPKVDQKMSSKHCNLVEATSNSPAPCVVAALNSPAHSVAAEKKSSYERENESGDDQKCTTVHGSNSWANLVEEVERDIKAIRQLEGSKLVEYTQKQVELQIEERNWKVDEQQEHQHKKGEKGIEMDDVDTNEDTSPEGDLAKKIKAAKYHSPILLHNGGETSKRSTPKKVTFEEVEKWLAEVLQETPPSTTWSLSHRRGRHRTRK